MDVAATDASLPTVKDAADSGSDGASRRVRSLPWHRRLEFRVVLGITLLIGGALGAVLLATNRIVQKNALTRATVDLQGARIAFYHLVDSRSAFAAAQLRLVAELPVFRAYLVESRLANDPASMNAMVDEYRSSLGAHFMVVTNAAGVRIADIGLPVDAAAPPELAKGVAEAITGHSQTDIVAFGNRLYLIVTEPTRFADEVLGTISAGFQLDDAVAAELALMTRCDVNLLAHGRLSGSSLPAAQQRALQDLLSRDANALGQMGSPADLRSIGNIRYVSGTYPVSREAGSISPGSLVLLQDWQPTQTFIDQVRSSVLDVGAVLFLLSLAGGIVVSRRTTGALSEMAAVTSEVAAGHWDRRVPVRGTDEAAALAQAFNEMTTALSHWHAEAQSKAAELQDSYERFFAVAQSAHDAIISTDHAGRIQFWNLSARNTFGYSDEEVRNRPVEELLDPATQLAYRERAGRLSRNETTSHGMMEGTGIRKDGSEFPLELSLATWLAGNESNFTAIVRDITLRKRNEATLRQREADLRQSQKMEAVGRLAGGIAHDFNNLLTAIRGYAELLVDDLGELDVRRDDALQIVKAADTAGSLTRQLLAFSRKQILAPRVVALDEIVRGMEKMLVRLIGEDVELTVRCDPDIWPVKADPGQIEQVVMNLAVNARDAMPTGGTLLVNVANVTLSKDVADARLGGECVELSVTDNGSGMDAETLAHIFEPFFTTKEEGRGTGLGLATVDGIVEQSGGSLLCESEVGRGTTFRIRLPRVDAARVAPEAAAARAKIAVSETVLLVEDEPAVRQFAHQVLTRAGYRVLEAPRGEEALVQSANHPAPIHLLLTDVVMPGMSGRVLWEQLSAIRSETKVLFMSGYTDDAVMRHRVRESGLPYLQKPFSVASLSDGVRRALAAERPSRPASQDNTPPAADEG